MKRALTSTPLRHPRFLEVNPGTDMRDVERFVAGLGNTKIVLKPCSQAASQGVRVFDTGQGCLDWLTSEGQGNRYDVEEFVEGTIYHFDGLVKDGRLHIFSASQCVGSCFDFVTHDRAFGAVTIDDKDLLLEAKCFTESVLRSFGLTDSVFHLEAIRAQEEFVFLEIANRFGGAGIPRVFDRVYGIKLPKEAYLADVGAPPATEGPMTILDRGHVGASAYLLIPIGRKERARVRSVKGLDRLPPSVFQAETPAIGQWFNEHPAFFANSGRFFFKGEGTLQLIQDARRVIENYAVGLAIPEEWPV